MYINLSQSGDGNVRICMDDEMVNRLAAVEKAFLVCTCKQYGRDRACSHTKTTEGKFKKWKIAQARKIRREIVSYTPIDVLRNTASEYLDVDLVTATLVHLEDGSIAVQWKGDPSKKYSFDSGWGACGQDATLVNEWPLVGMLQALTNSPDQTVWDPVMEETLLFPRELPVLPPVVLGNGAGSLDADRHPTLNASGGGLLSLDCIFDDNSNGSRQELSLWGKFWAAIFGLRLEGELVGSAPYLPDNRTIDQSVGGLAIDLLSQKVKPIPSAEIDRYSANIPDEFRRRVGHVHLPWGVEGDANIPCQVIVRHPSLTRIVKDDSVAVLTTNLWQGYESNEMTQRLLASVAGYMVRMGHKSEAYLHYGDESYHLHKLAEKADSHKTGGPWDVKPNAWGILKDKVVVAARNNIPVEEEIRGMNLGPDWPLLLPPESE